MSSLTYACSELLSGCWQISCQSRPCCYVLWLILHLQICKNQSRWRGSRSQCLWIAVCICVSRCECTSLCTWCALVLVFSLLCTYVGWEDWPAHGFSDVVPGFHLIFGPRRKECVTSWFMVNLNFQFVWKEKGEEELSPVMRLTFSLWEEHDSN